MSDEKSTQSTGQDPPIFEKLSLKTQHYLREATQSKTDENKQESDNMSAEQTFIAIKPDGVQRGLIAPIIARFEQRGYKLVAIKMIAPTEEFIKEHYRDLEGKSFFTGLTKFMTGRPMVAMVWEGKNVVKTGRALLGATNPLDSAPGTIRGDFAIDVGRNVCHGSDSVGSAQKEIKHWFLTGNETADDLRTKDEYLKDPKTDKIPPKKDIVQWENDQAKWIYE